ncbi:MAG: hypothetical protein EP329_18025 [Deltaproteobacteria bacterium]|nr:MAG: hypothetical protein EP329_18025 [Deltaproteobacteria bacterium]
MNCDDIDNAIYVYLDSEFADVEQVDFEAHVQACPRCRSLIAREGRLLESVRDAAPRVVAPVGLREKVLLALEQAPAPLPREEAPRLSRRRVPSWIASGIGLAAAAVLVVGLISGGADTTDQIAREAVAAHQTNPPMEVRGSERQIRQFLQDNVPFSIEVPFDGDPRVRLIGARLTRVNGRSAVLYNYEVDGERMSVVQVASHPDDLDPDRAPSVQSRDGFDVVTYRRKGITSSIVSSGAHPEMGRLIQAAYKR